jgi:cbb3-type cytochrome oxidase subunit 3
MDPMHWLTFGLLVFAWIQVWIMHRADKRAKRERETDEASEQRRSEHDEDVAYQTCYAEHFRVWALAKRYRLSDLVKLSAFRLLRPEDLLPRDWGLLTQMLGRLSPEAAALGALAVTHAYDTAASIATFNAAVAKLCADSASADITVQLRYVRDRAAELASHEERIRDKAEETAILLWDAIRHSKAGERQRTLDFKDDLQSELGKSFVAEMAARATEPGDGG